MLANSGVKIQSYPTKDSEQEPQKFMSGNESDSVLETLLSYFSMHLALRGWLSSRNFFMEANYCCESFCCYANFSVVF